MLVVSVLDVFNKYWRDVRDLSAKVQLAQIDTGILESRVEMFYNSQETFDVKYR